MSSIRGGLADVIVEHVRGRILRGEMRPGAKVDQEEIAEALDVSRSPIREALVVLGQEGLVELTPRRGAFVARICREDVIDHYELFGLVAGRAAALAAMELTAEQKSELADIHTRFVSADDADAPGLNHAFHELINAVAPDRTRWLLAHLERSIPVGFVEETPGWRDKAVAAHQVILDAIVNSDRGGARHAMESHLQEAGARAVETLESTGFWSTDE